VADRSVRPLLPDSEECLYLELLRG
jgi:hypothetical protein